MDYPKITNQLPFADYIDACRHMVKMRRQDLHRYQHLTDTIINANSPFESQINSPQKKRIGVLLTHGLLDCPFTFDEINSQLHQQGIMTRALLLPGHGTRPEDLIKVSYHDWLQVVRYGIDSLRAEVDCIFLMGYSTGASLSLYHALQDNHLAGLILIAPAIKLRAPVEIGSTLYHLSNQLSKNKDWVLHAEENDYAKYRSIAFNGVRQVVKLSEAIRDMSRQTMINQPTLMILSREDETIASDEAIAFFNATPNPQNRMLLYSDKPFAHADARIATRLTNKMAANMSSMSHPALAFSANNPHYGESGDYVNASRLNNGNYVYGAYNNIELKAFDIMNKFGFIDKQRRILTYNPDFSFMVESILAFIKNNA